MGYGLDVQTQRFFYGTGTPVAVDQLR